MKFWKQILLTTLAFFSITGTTLFMSCEKDQCAALQCQNGGNCVSGTCQCPSGYEGTSCETRSMDRYLDTYIGYTTAKRYIGNAGLTLNDTVVIFPGSNLSQVGVIMRAFNPDTVYGTISHYQSNYQIVVDTLRAANYQRTVTITLFDNIDPKGDKQLIIDKVITTDTVADFGFDGYQRF